MKTLGSNEEGSSLTNTEAWNFHYRKDEKETEKPKQHHDRSISEVRREKGKGISSKLI